jgi:hypothetical protein
MDDTNNCQHKFVRMHDQTGVYIVCRLCGLHTRERTYSPFAEWRGLVTLPQDTDSKDNNVQKAEVNANS